MTCREIVVALRTVGLAVERIDGDLDGGEFTIGSPRCLVTATRLPRTTTSAGSFGIVPALHATLGPSDRPVKETA
jgi:hypothetical protein